MTTKPGEIFGFGAEAVEEPRTHRGAAVDHRAGVHEGVRGVVIDRVGVERADDADVVGAGLAELGPDFGNRLARLAPLLERVLRAEAVELCALELGDLLAVRDRLGHRLAVQFGEFWLVIKGIEMCHAAGHVEPDDPLGFGRVMERVDDAFGVERASAAQSRDWGSIEPRAIAPRAIPGRWRKVRRQMMVVRAGSFSGLKKGLFLRRGPRGPMRPLSRKGAHSRGEFGRLVGMGRVSGEAAF